MTTKPAKAPKPLSAKKLDKAIEQLYYKHAQGRQINIMDIDKIFKAGTTAYAAASSLEDVEAAVLIAINAYTTTA
jgi:hypothetical protein